MHLFSTLNIRGVTLKNRIAVSPMCQYSSIDGFANDWHLVHLGSRAVGGAALIFTEAAAVTPEGRISLQDLGIWDDAHIDFLRRITDFISAQQAVAGIQLAHAGRKASTRRPWEGKGKIQIGAGGWEAAAPSPLPFEQDWPIPHALSRVEINEIVQNFSSAAKRSLVAGFKVIEIHSAHGYLLHEFLSPLSNHRRDEYGGDFVNRTRLLLEVVAAVRQIIPDSMPLFVRLSCTDYINGGWGLDQTIALCKLLKDAGVDLIDASSGGNIQHADIPVGPGYQIPFARRIRKEAQILTGGVGMIVEAHKAEKIIHDQQADIVLLAREMLRTPYWPLYAARELGDEADWPPQYQRAKSM